jgi:hypothetical protein
VFSVVALIRAPSLFLFSVKPLVDAAQLVLQPPDLTFHPL